MKNLPRTEEIKEPAEMVTVMRLKRATELNESLKMQLAFVETQLEGKDNSNRFLASLLTPETKDLHERIKSLEGVIAGAEDCMADAVEKNRGLVADNERLSKLVNDLQNQNSMLLNDLDVVKADREQLVRQSWAPEKDKGTIPQWGRSVIERANVQEEKYLDQVERLTALVAEVKALENMFLKPLNVGRMIPENKIRRPLEY